MKKLQNPVSIYFILLLFVVEFNFAQNANYKINDTIDGAKVITCIGRGKEFTYIGTNHGIIKIQNKNGKKKHFPTTVSANPNTTINSICVRKNGHVWFGTEQGIIVYDGFYMYTINMENSDLTDNRITSIVEDNNETVWIGTSNHGLLKKQNNHFKMFTYFNSNLPCNNIKEIVAENNGGLLVITNSQKNIPLEAIKSNR